MTITAHTIARLFDVPLWVLGLAPRHTPIKANARRNRRRRRG